jgi:signal transduction histidine kinase
MQQVTQGIQTEFQNYVSHKNLTSTQVNGWSNATRTYTVIRVGDTHQEPEHVVKGKEKQENQINMSILYGDGKFTTNFILILSKRSSYTGIVVAAIVSLIAFILLFSRQLSRKVRYMEEIETATNIMEGGNLDAQIPVIGTDELADIAESINALSKTLKERMLSEAQAQETNRKIIGDLSHDIRTPLTILSGYVPILLETEIDDTQRKYLELIEKKTDQLNDRVSDLLEYATIMSGQQKIHLEKVDFRSLVQNFIDEIKPFSKVEFLVEGEFFVNVDRQMLSRLFDNLASNIKQHANLEKKVSVHLIESDGYVELSVTNEIHPNGGENGKSLGLIISKMIAESLNGAFVASSSDNVFKSRLSLPINSEHLTK